MSDDFDFVRLYYTDQCVVDEDCFCELAASCVDGLQRVLTFRGDSDKEVLVAPAFGFFFCVFAPSAPRFVFMSRIAHVHTVDSRSQLHRCGRVCRIRGAVSRVDAHVAGVAQVLDV